MIIHINCGGQIVAMEKVTQVFAIDSIPDEDGFYDSGDLITQYDPFETEFECFKCKKTVGTFDMQE